MPFCADFNIELLPTRRMEDVLAAKEMIKYAGRWSHPESRADEEQMEKKLDWLRDCLKRVLTDAVGL